ncbi:hypothetical protein [Anaeromyxobacter soli]|uniref:hypothetical protein n=1 Tax=Anaeromyxobacter soli TaxID=2922725 RepID=UPI001FAED4A2|nr:hypothetical protein [Anaeromyxobacter sp. SG29]
MALRATEVFTPNDFPTHTYVARPAETLEQRLAQYLEVPKQVISVSGPSKSGKSVLIEKVVGRENLIPVFGAGISRADEIWDRALDWMGVPDEVARARTTGVSGEVSAEAKGKAGIPFVAQGEAGGSASVGASHERSRQETYRRRGLQQVAKEIAGSSFVVLLDDFHYIERTVQGDAARQIKEAAAAGIRIITASVPYRADDVVRANPELRGRLLSLDQSYWSPSDLMSIAQVGFGKLKVKLDDASIARFAAESAGSPQLMQVICLNACFELGVEEELHDTAEYPESPERLVRICKRAALVTDFRSLVSALLDGPRTRGTERKTYTFHDGSTGDVYRAVLKAVALDPPQLSFKYDEVVRRTAQLCHGDAPSGSSIIGTLTHMTRIADEKSPQDRVMDWDEQNLDMPNPYLLFYLRWSGRLDEGR